MRCDSYCSTRLRLKREEVAFGTKLGREKETRGNINESKARVQTCLFLLTKGGVIFSIDGSEKGYFFRKGHRSLETRTTFYRTVQYCHYNYSKNKSNDAESAYPR